MVVDDEGIFQQEGDMGVEIKHKYTFKIYRSRKSGIPFRTLKRFRLHCLIAKSLKKWGMKNIKPS